MYPEKTLKPDRLWLWVNPFRKIYPATCCDVPKKYSSRQPLAASSYRSRGLSSGPLRCPEKEQLQTAFGFGSILSKKPLQPSEIYPEKVQLQTAFGFGSIPCEKSHQPLEIYPGKTFTPDGLRLLVDPFRKISPAGRCDDSKKYSSRQPSALGQSFSKNLSSDLLRYPEKVQLQAAFGFWSIPCKKSR